jgi:Flp pilus assembly protein TadG
MAFMTRIKNSERGTALILFTLLATLVLVPMIGLAIDGSIVFWEKARLSAAVDAAALATGRALNTSLQLTTQQTSIEQVGQNYFIADFQPGHMGTTVLTPMASLVSLDTSTTSLVRISVQASVSVPLYFLRIFGKTTATISDTGQASRRDLNVIIVLDRSGSMATGTECSQLIQSAQNFSDLFVDGRDTLELITLQTTANIDYPASKTFKSGSPTLDSVIGNLVCSGATNTSMALSIAHSEIQKLNGPTKLNIVVFFTDGYPTAFYATFPTKKAYVDTRYSVTNPSATASTPKSGCSATTLAGVLTMPGQVSATTGTTYGIISPAGIPINSTAGNNLTLITAAGCSFPSNGAAYMRQDVAYIPVTDFYGNKTDTGYQPLLYFPSSNPYYNSGAAAATIRPDVPQDILNVAFNTADAAAASIRNDVTYNPIIYTIGLGTSVDTNFMMKVANDADYSGRDTTQPAGQYVYSPTSDQLNASFQVIASQILKLSQ